MVKCWIWGCLLAGIFGSCIRDNLEPCPPLTVKLVVKDKNYSNIEQMQELEEKKATDLPFKEYIPTLFYSLCDAETGEVLEEEGIIPVEDDKPDFTLPICGSCLPHGKFVLTVWGGLSDLSLLSDGRMTYHFHPNHAEGYDLYLTRDTLVYDYTRSDYVVDMERAKGKLIILMEGLDSKVNSMTQLVEPVSESVNSEFHYEGKTYMRQHILPIDSTGLELKTLVAPSCKNTGSLVRFSLYDEQNQELTNLNPKDVTVEMKRNTIAALKYVYKDDGTCAVYAMLDDGWIEVHDMDIEE